MMAVQMEPERITEERICGTDEFWIRCRTTWINFETKHRLV